MILEIMQGTQKHITAYFLPRQLNINEVYISSSSVLLAGGGLTLAAMDLLLPGFTGVSL